MKGTLINAAAICIGSLAGILVKGGLKEKYVDIIMQAIGLSVLFVGAASAVGGLLNESSNAILFIISLVLGSAIGEAVGIEQKLEALGDFLQNKMKKSNDNVSQGFVTASLVFCVGTMAIVGAIESGIQGAHTTLYVKSILDGITSVIFASTLGAGVMLSAVSVLIYQGLITLFASFLQPYLTGQVMTEMSIVGGILIFAIGINMLGIKKIKVGNMLPAIFIPPVYFAVLALMG